jgi:WD40 repeat protein
VLTWDIGTRQQLGTPLTGHTDGIRSVACVQGYGYAIAVTASDDQDGTIRVWDLDDRQQIGKPITGHTDRIKSVACTHLDGRPIAVTASMDVVTASSDGDGVIQMWNLDGQQQIGDPRAGHTSEVRSMACTHRNGHPIVVTADWDGTVRMWDLTEGRPIGTLPIQSGDAVTCTHLYGRSIAVTGGGHGTIRVWDLATRRQISKLATGQYNIMSRLACTQVNGHLIVAAVGDFHDRLVWMWDLTSRRQIGDPLTGHTEDISSVACASVNGRPIIVSAGGNEKTGRMWDLITQRQIGDPMMVDPSGCARGVACTELAGRPVAVTGGSSVRVWDLTTQQQIGDPMTGKAYGVDSVVCTNLDGRPIAVTHSWRDASVSVWDVIASEQVATIRLPSPVEAIAAMNDTIVAAFGWDIAAFRRIPGKMQWAPVS